MSAPSYLLCIRARAEQERAEERERQEAAKAAEKQRQAAVKELLEDLADELREASAGTKEANAELR